MILETNYELLVWTDSKKSSKIQYMKSSLCLLPILLLLPACQQQITPPESWTKKRELPAHLVLDAGLTRTTEKVDFDGITYKFIVYTIDQAQYRFDLYHDESKRLSDWSESLKAQIVFNGAYFTEDLEPTARLVIDGLELGKNEYTSATSGTIHIDRNSLSITNSTQTISTENTLDTDIVQSFPMLIDNQKSAVKEPSELIARRTVIGVTNDNQVQIIIIDQTPISLYHLSLILEQSPFELKTALNLDGGPSTGLEMRVNDYTESITALTPLPQVISVTKRPQD